MLKKNFLFAAIAVALGASSGVQAYMIDDFKSGAQDSGSLDAFGTTYSDDENGSMATGNRDLWVGVTADGGTNAQAVVDTSGLGRLLLSNGPGVLSNLIIDWDSVGTPDDPSGAPTGYSSGWPPVASRNLGTASTPINLTDLGVSDAFFFDVVSSDGNAAASPPQGFTFWIDVTDADQGLQSYTASTYAAIPSPGSVFGPIPFSAFSGTGDSTGFDKVTRISLRIQSEGDAPDFIIDNFYTGKTPEPAALALFGLGLAGLGAVRRRYRS
jgi:hypothetical protein